MTGIIYEPQGRASEYGSLACNLFRGCSHRCRYCYAPNVLHMTREEFSHPVPRANVLQQLEKEARARQLSGKTGQVFLCFTTDPYIPEDSEVGVTRQAIQILHDTGHTVRVLTKGGTRAMRDLDLFGPGDAFGVTLTCLSEQNTSEWEPGSAMPWERVRSLCLFHQSGIPTWVSMEPVIFPTSALDMIKWYYPVVDHWKIGAMNYHPHAKTIDWPKFAREVVQTLESVGASYTLKDDLKRYLPKEVQP